MIELINFAVLLFGLAVIVWLYFYLLTNYFGQQITTDSLIVSEEVDFQPAKKTKQHKSPSWQVKLLVYTATLLGMLSIILYGKLSKDGFVDFGKFRIDILLTILVSPVIFLAILNSNPNLFELKNRGYLVIFLTGYQNGFFWQTIFGEIFKRLQS